MRTEHKKWNAVKGKIISSYGTIGACAAIVGCSEDGLRKAVDGRCPGIAIRLKIVLNFDWEAAEAVAA